MSLSFSALVMSTRSSEKSLSFGNIRCRKREFVVLSQLFLLLLFSIICIVGIVVDALQGKRPSERWVFMFLGICCVLLPSPIISNSGKDETIYKPDLVRADSFATV